MSKPIDLAEIQAAQVEAAAAETDTEAKRAKVRELNKQLHDGILAGETTGDRLTDHVIRRNRGHNPEAVELFRSLEERVAAHVGEPVLVISRGIDYQRHVFGEGMKDPYVVTAIKAGILSSPELNIGEDGDWSFPTDLHAIRGGGVRGSLVRGRGFTVAESPLTTAYPGRFSARFSPLEGSLDVPGVGGESLGEEASEKRLQIAVGIAEVEKLAEETLFFNQQQLEEMLDELMRFPAGTEAG